MECQIEPGRFPLVSVIVLSYRNVEGITPTLLSILDQDYPNIEVIVSDDGTDGFQSLIPEIENLIREKNKGNIVNIDVYTLECNQGTVRNANAAVRRAHGEYVKTISPEDCFARRDAISQYVRFMQTEGCLVAFAKLRGVNNEGEYVYNLAACEDDYALLKTLAPQQILNKLYARNFLPGAAEFFDSRVFELYGMFPEVVRLIEDYSYWLHLAMCDVRFGFLDEILVDYRLSGVSSSGHYGQAFMNDMYVIYEEYVFPHDKRFGVFQPIYNKLKRWGLDYYMAEAQRGQVSAFSRAFNRVRYLPFHLLTRYQAVRFRIRNRRCSKS